MRRVALCVLATAFALSLAACDKHDPVPASACASVVKHARKILGPEAEPKAKMMKSCRGATDSQRGCAMAATSAVALMRCTM